MLFDSTIYLEVPGYDSNGAAAAMVQDLDDRGITTNISNTYSQNNRPPVSKKLSIFMRTPSSIAIANRNSIKPNFPYKSISYVGSNDTNVLRTESTQQEILESIIYNQLVPSVGWNDNFLLTDSGGGATYLNANTY